MSYRQLDHTADVALEFSAPTLPALFLEAARAVIDVLTEGASVVGSSQRTTELEVTDFEDGLVVWLNEILYWAVNDDFLFEGGEVVVERERIVATARGESGAVEKLATELKSVTYHHLLLEERADGWFGRVVIDV
ncbi:MAG: archease [Deltaproteobacteria bacterium]|jgi:SHS2 domain-containing protein